MWIGIKKLLMFIEMSLQVTEARPGGRVERTGDTSLGPVGKTSANYYIRIRNGFSLWIGVPGNAEPSYLP